MSTTGESKVPPSERVGVANGATETTPNGNPEDVPVVSENGTTRKRVASLTEKGRERQFNTLTSFMKTMHKHLQKNIDLIHLLIDGDNEELVNNECTNLDKIYTELSDAYSRIGMLFKVDDFSEKYTNVTIKMDETDSKYFACKEAACKWLLDGERRSNASSRRSSRSGRTSIVSNVTSSSQHSNLSLKQKAKVAGLKAEVEFVKRRREAELSAELLYIEQKIKKAEAMEKVYAAVEAKETTEDVSNSKCAKIDDKKRADTKKSNYDSFEITNDLQTAMVQMLKLQAAPKPDIDVFSGNPLDYSYFKARFKEVVEVVVTDQRGRLTRLIKYTDGDAKDLIKHFVDFVQ